MANTGSQKIVIIGCGNVAWHITKKLASLRKFEVEVYNHKANPALATFKKVFGCKTVIGLHKISDDALFYLICVPDKHIYDTAKHITSKNARAVLLHTSGSAAVDELGERIHSTGVFYPLQTFSKTDEVNWKEVPVIIEATDKESLRSLSGFANLFTKKVLILKSKERLKLHFAAVLVNNFTNSLYVAADQLLKDTSYNNQPAFKLLLPLIAQTTKKISVLEPLVAQTGPAKRGDNKVMEKHLGLISKKTDLRKLYKLMSRIIMSQQKITYAEFQGETK